MKKGFKKEKDKAYSDWIHAWYIILHEYTKI